MRVGGYEAQPAPRIVGGDFPVLAQAAAEGNTFALWLATLPSLAKLDIMTYRVVSVGLPLLTVGIITGAWWAKEAWGAYWQWDPKETAALVCISTRATAGAAYAPPGCRYSALSRSCFATSA
jgi:ABC-type transport system involved in cytochrome c biogenesis permease subunit